jgi:uncharacterized protein
MKSLNICVDIDGTVTDGYYWLELSNKHFSKDVKREQVTQYDIPTVLGVTNEEYDEFYKKYKIEIHSKDPIKKHAKEILEKLSIKHKIYFITARDTELKETTHSYFREYEIHYDGIFMLGSHYKLDQAKDLCCDIFIEDNYNTASELAEAGIRVLLMDHYYNRRPLLENMVRVHNWDEVYNIIEN